jgi:hypothetical protein
VLRRRGGRHETSAWAEITLSSNQTTVKLRTMFGEIRSDRPVCCACKDLRERLRPNAVRVMRCMDVDTAAKGCIENTQLLIRLITTPSKQLLPLPIKAIRSKAFVRAFGKGCVLRSAIASSTLIDDERC